MNKFFSFFYKGKNLPVVAMPDLFDDDGCVKMLEPLTVSGNISVTELLVINKLICRYQPRAVFEIGTFDGRTALNIAANTMDETKIFTLDLPSKKLKSTRLPIARGDREFINKKESGCRYHGRPQEKKIVQLYGDSADFDFSPYEDKMDFVFVDGSHAYDYVMNDSMIALKLLKEGKGIILWHDYIGWVGVRKALLKLYERGGVFKDIKHIKGTSLVCLIIK